MGKYLILVLALIAGIYTAAIVNSWYWDYWWLDIPLHLAGGAWLAAAFYYIFAQKKAAMLYRSDFFITLVLTLGFIALIGILWEFYEYSYDVLIAGRHGWLNVQKGLSDTLKDLMNDLIGGTLGTIATWFVVGKRERR